MTPPAGSGAARPYPSASRLRDAEALLGLGPAGPPGRHSAAADALALAQLVRDAVTAGIPRQALHLRLSRLDARMRQAHHRRLLREALEPALRPVRSRLFELPNGDLVAVAPPQGQHLHAAEALLAILLAPGDDPAEAQPEALYVMLDLPRDAAALLAAVEEALGPPPLPARRDTAAGFLQPDFAAVGGLHPGGEPPGFAPAELGALERALHGASLARFLQRRPVCRLARGGAGPELAWEEWRLPWPELRAALLSTADPAAAPWLGRRLRRILDRRLLTELARPEEGRRGPLGLSLAAASLGEPEFLRLDAMLDAATRARSVLGLPAEDALADADGFAFARDFARARGYRLALDLAGPGPLGLLPADLWGMDLLRLPWTAELARAAPILPQGPEQVVLTGADRAAAIGWGWEAGVTLFEGRLLQPRG